MPTPIDVLTIAFNPASPGTLYATSGQGNPTFPILNSAIKSDDGGATWSRLSLNAAILCLAFDAVDRSIVYAGTAIPGPALTGASMNGKALSVTGQGFHPGDIIFVSDQGQNLAQKTIYDGPNPTVLVAPKAGSVIAPGQTVQISVVEPDATASSNALTFTRPPG